MSVNPKNPFTKQRHDTLRGRMDVDNKRKILDQMLNPEKKKGREVDPPRSKKNKIV